MIWKTGITLSVLLALTTVKADQQLENASILHDPVAINRHVSVAHGKSHRHKKGGLGYKSGGISSAHYANENHSGSRSWVSVETHSVKLMGWGYDRDGNYYECNPYDKNCPFGDTYHDDAGYDSKHSYADHSYGGKQEHSHHGKGHNDYYDDEDSCPYVEDDCAENPTCSSGTTITRVVSSTITVDGTTTTSPASCILLFVPCPAECPDSCLRQNVPCPFTVEGYCPGSPPPSTTTSISEPTITSVPSNCPEFFVTCPVCPEGATCNTLTTTNGAGCPWPSGYCDPITRGGSLTASLINSYPTTFNSETTY